MTLADDYLRACKRAVPHPIDNHLEEKGSTETRKCHKCKLEGQKTVEDNSKDNWKDNRSGVRQEERSHWDKNQLWPEGRTVIPVERFDNVMYCQTFQTSLARQTLSASNCYTRVVQEVSRISSGC